MARADEALGSSSFTPALSSECRAPRGLSWSSWALGSREASSAPHSVTRKGSFLPGGRFTSRRGSVTLV